MNRYCEQGPAAEMVKNREKLLERRVADLEEGVKEYGRLSAQLHDMVRDRRWLLERPDTHRPLPVLVITCNRPFAVTYLVEKLLRLRPSAHLFPLLISQDCDNEPVRLAVARFQSDVIYVKHESAQKAAISIPKEHKKYATYYMIARHYKLALNYAFDTLNYDSVVIIEDDLDISEDFFEYFLASRELLDKDKSLYCVSAWNDNGKPYLIDESANNLLYRTDFFPGLGWLLSRQIWNEVKSDWPVSFWDDWIREPHIRKDRACIRPEISRTAMTVQGKQGASRGLFYKKHLAKIKLNDRVVPFTQNNLSYLLKSNYDKDFLSTVYSLPIVTLNDMATKQFPLNTDSRVPDTVRLQYNSREQYLEITKKLGLMSDFKAGVGRTAYRGIVSCFISKMRIYIAPNANWTHYDKSWIGPPEII